MKLSRKKKVACGSILLIIFGFFWAGTLFFDLKYGRINEEISIAFDVDKTYFPNINVQRITPSGSKENFYKDAGLHSFYSKRNGFVKNLVIIVPDNHLPMIRNILIRIGKSRYEISSDDLRTQWSLEKEGSNLVFTSPPTIRGKRSAIPPFSSIINWKGDWYIIFTGFIKWLAVFSGISAILYLIYIKMKKGLPQNTSNGIIQEVNYILSCDKSTNNYYGKIFTLLFAVIIFIAVLQRLVQSPVPLSGKDTWGYIGPAVSACESSTFHLNGIRNFPYPLWVFTLLNIFHDFSFITVIQHMLGLMTGILLFIVWKQLLLPFTKTVLQKVMLDLTGLVIMMLYLFHYPVIYYEHALRPESIYPFFLLAQIMLLKLIIRNKKRYTVQQIIISCLFFVNNYFLFLLQPRYGLTLFLNIIIFITCFIIFYKFTITQFAIHGVTPIIITIVLVYLPQQILVKSEGATGGFFSGMTFFTHAKIIDKVMEMDIKDPHYMKYDKSILIELQQFFHKEFNEPQTKHKFLGFYLNHLYHGEANGYLRSNLPENRYNEFCWYYIIKAIKKHPILYIKKVILELSQYYNFYGGMYVLDKNSEDSSMYDPDTYWEHTDPFEWPGYLPFRTYENRRELIHQSIYDLPELKFTGIQLIFFVLSLTYILCMIAFFVLFIKNIIPEMKLKKVGKLSRLGIFIALIYCYSLCINLTNSIVYCLDLDRYIVDQTVLTLFSQAISIVYICIYFVKEKTQGLAI